MNIPLLANHFLEQLNKIEGKFITGFEDNVIDAFSDMTGLVMRGIGECRRKGVCFMSECNHKY